VADYEEAQNRGLIYKALLSALSGLPHLRGVVLTELMCHWIEDCFGTSHSPGLCPQNPPFETPAMKQWRRLGIEMFGQRDRMGRDIVNLSDTDYLAIVNSLGETMKPDKQLPREFLQAARSISYCPLVILPIALRQTGETLDSFFVKYPRPLLGILRTTYLASWNPIRSPFSEMLRSVRRLSLTIFEDSLDQQERLRAEQNLTQILQSIDNLEELALVKPGLTERRQVEMPQLGDFRLGFEIICSQGYQPFPD
jgi:hypothetical protein